MSSPYEFKKLSSEIVQDWALDTLEEWLEGYTFPQDNVPLQYRVRPHDDGTFEFEPITYGAGFPDLPTQRFKISIAVEEVSDVQTG